MVIEKLVDRELTKGEIDSIERFRLYTDGVSYACVGERIMVMIDIDDQKNPEKLKSVAKEIVDEALNTHPDFEVFFMDDGNVLLMLTCGVFAFTKKPVDEKDRNLGLYMILRNQCLEACENGEILAVVYEE